jgi:hypothetical protein
MVTFLMLGPNTAMTAMMRRIKGNANCISPRRIKIESIRPRKYPEKSPMGIPKMPPINKAVILISKEIRDP